MDFEKSRQALESGLNKKPSSGLMQDLNNANKGNKTRNFLKKGKTSDCKT